MATRSIPRAEWTSTLDSFSRAHLGATATLEVLGTDVGDQLVGEGIFRGISADEKDGENRIAIMVGGSIEDGTTHTVSSPTEVWLKGAEGDTGDVLEVWATDAKTLLSIVPPAVPATAGAGS
ncbi:MAG: DUF5335 family protein [Chloroflexota bacterium]